jgi:hypothetical protein
VVRSEPAPRQRSGARTLDDDVGDGEQLPQFVGLAVEIQAIGQLFAVDPIKEGAISGAGAVRATDVVAELESASSPSMTSTQTTLASRIVRWATPH